MSAMGRKLPLEAHSAGSGERPTNIQSAGAMVEEGADAPPNKHPASIHTRDVTKGGRKGVDAFGEALIEANAERGIQE